MVTSAGLVFPDPFLTTSQLRHEVDWNCGNTDEMAMSPSQLYYQFKQLQILARKKNKILRLQRDSNPCVSVGVRYQMKYEDPFVGSRPT